MSGFNLCSWASEHKIFLKKTYYINDLQFYELMTKKASNGKVSLIKKEVAQPGKRKKTGYRNLPVDFIKSLVQDKIFLFFSSSNKLLPNKRVFVKSFLGTKIRFRPVSIKILLHRIFLWGKNRGHSRRKWVVSSGIPQMQRSLIIFLNLCKNLCRVSGLSSTRNWFSSFKSS